ncbi:Hsp20/alpha crystallin family protein [Halalkalicoccus salilacus]|uniref:Hsp20/alpha crystallin family protein n=1 Tax=Halalkalicoccus salilacus TaxID=3117459 RepID=UPI00300F76F5
MPKQVEDEEIDATYRNGVLEVTLPIVTGATQRGRSRSGQISGGTHEDRPSSVLSSSRSQPHRERQPLLEFALEDVT